jgi:hypothetical protein
VSPWVAPYSPQVESTLPCQPEPKDVDVKP